MSKEQKTSNVKSNIYAEGNQGVTDVSNKLSKKCPWNCFISESKIANEDKVTERS